MASPLNETSPSRIPSPSALSLTIANVRARGCPWLLEEKGCLHESSGYLGSISERMGAVVAVDNRTDFCVWSGAVVKHMAISMAATCKAQVAMHISSNTRRLRPAVWRGPRGDELRHGPHSVCTSCGGCSMFWSDNSVVFVSRLEFYENPCSCYPTVSMCASPG
ncbi:hypothetical protein D8B26_003535 [Coccidioides posadasii str. Silveira]|uniref:uncharacterized protein n=1 Tax=Coccidioides posadasii (strain RMSCC 757 / Silveira) TaxID=443226 RepID=UPI001BEFC358|nr:hypothetical protein D8B26_003535 [Coccidioides posadasii str. Silveira]